MCGTLLGDKGLHPHRRVQLESQTGVLPVGLSRAAPCTWQPYTKTQNSVTIPGSECARRDGAATQPSPTCRGVGTGLGQAQGSPSPGHTAPCVLTATPVWPQSPPPPSQERQEESRNQLPRMRQRGARFSTSSELTISFFSKKYLFFSSSLSGTSLAEVPQKLEGGWEEVLIWTSCQASLPRRPTFHSGSLSPDSSAAEGNSPGPAGMGGRWAEGQRGACRLLSLREEKKTSSCTAPSFLGRLGRGSGGGGDVGASPAPKT